MHPSLNARKAALVLLCSMVLMSKAELPRHVEACVEIYDLPTTAGGSFKTSFGAAEPGARSGLLQRLRDGTFTKGVQLVAFGHRTCQPGEPSTVSALKEYVYPVKFSQLPSGPYIPADFEMTALGCEMTLDIAAGTGQGGFAVTTMIKDVERLSPARDTDVKPDAKGVVIKPVFNVTDIRTTVEAQAGVPWLASSYPSNNGSQTRLVLITVYAAK